MRFCSRHGIRHYIVANGSSLATHGSGDFWIARYDNNGTPIWMQLGGGRTLLPLQFIALSPTADAVYVRQGKYAIP